MKKVLFCAISALSLLSACSNQCSDGSCSLCPKECPSAIGCQADKASAYFAIDSSVLSHDDKENLDNVVARLKANPNEKVRISGYTDNTGPESYNMQLSKNRAMSAARYLETHGIASHRIMTQGYGATHFADPNTTEAGRARNRRIEVSFFH